MVLEELNSKYVFRVKTVRTLYHSACFFALHRSECCEAHSCHTSSANIAESLRSTTTCNIKNPPPINHIDHSDDADVSCYNSEPQMCVFNSNAQQCVFLLSCRDSSWKLSFCFVFCFCPHLLKFGPNCWLAHIFLEY